MNHDSDEAKRAFALELIKNPNNPFQAALVVFPNDTGWCLRVMKDWVADPVVKEEMKRLKAEANDDELAFLPGRGALARALWDRMMPADGRYVGNEDFNRFAKTYAEIMDFVPKTTKVDANVKTSSTIQIIASELDQKL